MRLQREGMGSVGQRECSVHLFGVIGLCRAPFCSFLVRSRTRKRARTAICSMTKTAEWNSSVRTNPSRKSDVGDQLRPRCSRKACQARWQLQPETRNWGRVERCVDDILDLLVQKSIGPVNFAVASLVLEVNNGAVCPEGPKEYEGRRRSRVVDRHLRAVAASPVKIANRGPLDIGPCCAK